MAPKSIALDDVTTQNNGHCAVQGHLSSPLSVLIEGPYATMVNNSILHPISHHF